jgi:hypothetical protein
LGRLVKRRRTVQLGALGLALVGYWLPWLTHPVAALRLNGYELSEWVTFLPGVRDGSLPLGRLVFLLPLGCLALLFGLAATWQVSRPPRLLTASSIEPARTGPRSGLNALLPSVRGVGGWGLLLISLVCVFIVFPPYPYLLTAYADPEYRTQLFVASFGVVLLLLALYLPSDFKAALQIVLAALGGGLGLWGLLVLHPAAVGLLGASWAIGLGWPLMLAGFALLLLGGWRELFGPRI